VSGFVGLTVSDGGTSAAAPLGVLGFALVTVITSSFMVRDKPRTEP
jgi:succinate-acetate transporter protein